MKELIISAKSQKQICSKIEEAIQEIGFSVDDVDFENGIIEATTGMSVWSFGETIMVDVENVSPSSFKIIITSTSDAQLWAWGKNNKNEQRIFDSLSKVFIVL